MDATEQLYLGDANRARRDLEVAFLNCVSLQNIDLDTDITTVKNKLEWASFAFAGCKDLVTVNLHDYFADYSLITAKCMFKGCSSLTHIYGVIDITKMDTLDGTAYHMFDGCTNLQSVTIKYEPGNEYNDLTLGAYGDSSLPPRYLRMGLTAEQMANVVTLIT